MLHIRKAEARDAAAIAEIILPTIREGATYTLDQDLSEKEALAYWMGPDKETFIAEQEGAILGTYFIRPNQAGGGRHVCNCGYMTAAAATGRGVARRMWRALARARALTGLQSHAVQLRCQHERACGEAMAVSGI